MSVKGCSTGAGGLLQRGLRSVENSSPEGTKWSEQTLIESVVENGTTLDYG